MEMGSMIRLLSVWGSMTSKSLMFTAVEYEVWSVLRPFGTEKMTMAKLWKAAYIFINTPRRVIAFPASSRWPNNEEVPTHRRLTHFGCQRSSSDHLHDFLGQWNFGDRSVQMGTQCFAQQRLRPCTRSARRPIYHAGARDWI